MTEPCAVCGEAGRLNELNVWVHRDHYGGKGESHAFVLREIEAEL